ncbi:MAG: hypothetical protein CL736_01655 [Chloroflexi bacterium]|nr:hypothetical protein [Chloroflexota bacterium]|tara:strand:- start:12592 stop:13659 length:1068 start_codon:yes stop_codon:yes gene_type:complete
MNIAIFIISLAIIVLLHELGHFIAGKFFKVKVEEFGIGFPPRILKLKHKETIYSINSIPLGGFVKFSGEDNPNDPQSLESKPAYQRFIIIAVGPLINLVLAIILFSSIYMIPRDAIHGDIAINSVAVNSPAEIAGVLPGDIIKIIHDEKIKSPYQVEYLLNYHQNNYLKWEMIRDNQNVAVELKPIYDNTQKKYIAGINLEIVDPYKVSIRYNPLQSLQKGTSTMIDFVIMTKNEISSAITGTKPLVIAGPIGMAQAYQELNTQNNFSLKQKILFTINLMAIINLTLAIFNFLPIPALDGGRLFFILIEMIRGGKKISIMTERLIHVAGFFTLIMLAIIISWADLMRIFNGESIL